MIRMKMMMMLTARLTDYTFLVGNVCISKAFTQPTCSASCDETLLLSLVDFFLFAIFFSLFVPPICPPIFIQYQLLTQNNSICLYLLLSLY